MAEGACSANKAAKAAYQLDSSGMATPKQATANNIFNFYGRKRQNIGITHQ